MARSDILPYKIYVGGRPIEELTEQERKDFAHRAAEQMANAINDYFTCHPEEFLKWKNATEKREREEKERERHNQGTCAAQPRAAGHV